MEVESGGYLVGDVENMEGSFDSTDGELAEDVTNEGPVEGLVILEEGWVEDVDNTYFKTNTTESEKTSGKSLNSLL